jgi:hypothetical protein
MTTIFYVNSAGFMCRWKGTVVSKDDKSIVIKFSKNKVLRFNLKDLDIDFCLVTKSQMKRIGVCLSENTEAICFDDNLKEIVLEKTKGNVEYLWTNGQWKI